MEDRQGSKDPPAATASIPQKSQILNDTGAFMVNESEINEEQLLQEYNEGSSMIHTTATSNEHENFSYLALLRGEIDITSLADSDCIPHVVGRGVSSTTCNWNETTKASIEKQSNYSSIKQSQSCTTMGLTHKKNNDDANRRSEEQSASAKYSEYQTDFSEDNNGNQNAEDNPWDSRIFEDIELVEVEIDKNTGG